MASSALAIAGCTPGSESTLACSCADRPRGGGAGHVHRDRRRRGPKRVGGHTVVARRVLAASGLVDELPEIDGVAEHGGRDVIHCPRGQGFEVRDRRVVQIVTHLVGLHPAALFRRLTDRLTLVLHGAVALDDPRLDELRTGGATVVDAQVRRVVGVEGRVTAVELADGRQLDADAVVVTARFRPRIDAFASIGLTAVEHPSGLGAAVVVDRLGGDALWLAERGRQATATDVSGRALERAAAEARRRGLQIEIRRADANALAPFENDRFDPVTAQYTSIPRTPHGRAVENLLRAVAPGGTLLVVSHDLAPMRGPVDTTGRSRPFDPDACVRVDDVVLRARRVDM